MVPQIDQPVVLFQVALWASTQKDSKLDALTPQGITSGVIAALFSSLFYLAVLLRQVGGE